MVKHVRLGRARFGLARVLRSQIRDGCATFLMGLSRTLRRVFDAHDVCAVRFLLRCGEVLDLERFACLQLQIYIAQAHHLPIRDLAMAHGRFRHGRLRVASFITDLRNGLVAPAPSDLRRKRVQLRLKLGNLATLSPSFEALRLGLVLRAHRHLTRACWLSL